MLVIRRTDELKKYNLVEELAGADARGVDFWGVELPDGARLRGLLIEQWQIPFLVRALGIRVVPDSSPGERKPIT